MSEEGVRESIEFFFVNFTWSLGVNLLSSLLDPIPLIGGDGVVLGFGEPFNSFLDFIVGEGTIMVGIEGCESFFGLIFVNTYFFNVLLLFLSFFNKVAEIEMLEEGVGEFVEFFFVNFTWSLGVNLLSSLHDPFPLILGDFVIKGFGELLNSNLDFIVGEGTIMVGIEGFETFIGELFGGTAFSLSFDSDGRGGGDECDDGEFHFSFVLFYLLLYFEKVWLLNWSIYYNVSV